MGTKHNLIMALFFNFKVLQHLKQVITETAPHWIAVWSTWHSVSHFVEPWNISSKRFYHCWGIQGSLLEECEVFEHNDGAFHTGSRTLEPGLTPCCL